MIQWRIYTERKNTEKLIKFTQQLFPNNGATFYSSLGSWQNKVEESLVIEIIGTSRDEYAVNNLAHTIKGYNNQQAVLVTATELCIHNLA